MLTVDDLILATRGIPTYIVERDIETFLTPGVSWRGTGKTAALRAAFDNATERARRVFIERYTMIQRWIALGAADSPQDAVAMLAEPQNRAELSRIVRAHERIHRRNLARLLVDGIETSRDYKEAMTLAMRVLEENGI